MIVITCFLYRLALKDCRIRNIRCNILPYGSVMIDLLITTEEH